MLFPDFFVSLFLAYLPFTRRQGILRRARISFCNATLLEVPSQHSILRWLLVHPAQECKPYRVSITFILSTRKVKIFPGFFMPPHLILAHTVYTLDQLPATPLPHIALAGRSNVGKSSLINALAGQRNLAKVSATPGKTRSLNFYRTPDDTLYLVDLPGYGYARCSKAEQALFSRLIEGYLIKNTVLRALVLLLDCRLEPQKSDMELAGFAGQERIPLFPVLTKADKCSLRERAQRQKHWAALLDGRTPLLCSTVKGWGVETLWGELRRIAGIDA
jgi:GTP-binding protein